MRQRQKKKRRWREGKLETKLMNERGKEKSKRIEEGLGTCSFTLRKGIQTEERKSERSF